MLSRLLCLFLSLKKLSVNWSNRLLCADKAKVHYNNYIRRIALFVVHFGKLPEQIDPDEINEYLAALARDPRSPSRSSFKHMVYGLRYYYRLLGMNKNAIALPSLKKDTKLPVILNQRELKELFSCPNTSETADCADVDLLGWTARTGSD